MNFFPYRDGLLHCDTAPADQLAAEHGTPLYVYSRAALEDGLVRIQTAFSALQPTICFSVKSCQNLSLLRVLREAGSGFDVVSGGELYRAQQAQADPGSLVFAGVGKTDDEIREAIAAGVGLLNVESESELRVIDGLAGEQGVQVSCALRVNPDVDADTHEYTTTGTRSNKFGVPIDEAAALFRLAAQLPHVLLRGLHIHIGSPVRSLDGYRRSLERVVATAERLRADGHTVDKLDLGGGMGAVYDEPDGPELREYAEVMNAAVGGRGFQVVLEPGRSIAANAAVLLTRVLHVKSSGARTFAVVDASMNELLRPALYQAYHFIWPVQTECVPRGTAAVQAFPGLVETDVVGPICETTDFLARGRGLPPLQRGDLLAVFSCGAYAMTMASQYNSRPRAAEVLVEAGAARVIRRRETYDDLIEAERT